MLLSRLTLKAMSITWKLFTVLTLILLPGRAFAAGNKATHIVLVVWDGMRPDFVTAANTPNLVRLAGQGVEFKKHHSVYPCTTEVNATALATGVYPGQSGIVGNKEFRPAINPADKVFVEQLEVVRKGDSVSGGRYLLFPTAAETLHSRGLRTVIAGAKDVVLLQDRAARRADALGVTVFAGQGLPEERLEALTHTLGRFPAQTNTGLARDLWTTRALVGPLWEKGVPALSVLWLSEPDLSQHDTGPGSPASLAAIRHSDDALGRVLAALDEKGLRAQTDVIVVSDHGFSTIDQTVDLADALKGAGFHAYRSVPAGGARESDVMVVGNSSSVFLYVKGHQTNDVEKVVHFLQAQPYCGVVLTQQPVDGAFRLRDLRLDAPSAPDIIVALRWRRDPSKYGAPGLDYTDSSKYGPGQGIHGTLSPYEMHNTCVAAGPDFRVGFKDDLPTGNIDVAPTVLWLLGVAPQRQPAGRVLREALVESGTAKPVCETHRLEASCPGDGFTWRQYVNYSEVNGVLYFDEGNGEQAPPRVVGGS